MNEKIISQIQKLRSLATSSNEHEAAAAAKAADRLCEKHRITEAELSFVEGSIVADVGYLYSSGRVTQWKQCLAIFLSKHYGCMVFNEVSKATGRKVSNFKLVGIKSDIDLVRYMFSWLVQKLKGLP